MEFHKLELTDGHTDAREFPLIDEADVRGLTKSEVLPWQELTVIQRRGRKASDTAKHHGQQHMKGLFNCYASVNPYTYLQSHCNFVKQNETERKRLALLKMKADLYSRRHKCSSLRLLHLLDSRRQETLQNSGHLQQQISQTLEFEKY